MENKASSENINSGMLAGIYKTGFRAVGDLSKKGGIKFNGIFANPAVKEKPVLTIQSASGRNK